MRNPFIVVVNPRGMALMHNFVVETGFAVHHLPDNNLPRKTSNRHAVGHALNMTPFEDDEEALAELQSQTFFKIPLLPFPDARPK